MRLNCFTIKPQIHAQSRRRAKDDGGSKRGGGCRPDAAIERASLCALGFCLLLADYEATTPTMTSTPNECTDKTFIGYCLNDAALFLMMSWRTMPGKTFVPMSLCPLVRAEPGLIS